MVSILQRYSHAIRSRSKGERIYLHLTRRTLYQVQEILLPYQQELTNIASLAAKHQQSCQEHQDNYNKEKQYTITAEAECLGCSTNKVTLPISWLPPRDNPWLSKLPWIYTDERKQLVKQVTTAWVKSKQLGIKDIHSMATTVEDSSNSDVQSIESGITNDED